MCIRDRYSTIVLYTILYLYYTIITNTFFNMFCTQSHIYMAANLLGIVPYVTQLCNVSVIKLVKEIVSYYQFHVFHFIVYIAEPTLTRLYTIH